jgi:photosystem II stability/assembly factor-like uncharacterized protein
MRRIFLLLTLTMAFTIGWSQPWLKNLPTEKSQEQLTLHDHQEAFNTYWENFTMERGFYFDNEGKKHKAPGWKQFKRWEWFLESEVDAETGAFPKTTANEVYQKWHAANPQQKNRAANWEVIGPNTSEGGYAGIGRINSVSFHPTDNNTWWIGAPAGGLWETTDNGNSWTCLTDNNAVLGVSDIYIPDNYATSNTIYIATGDKDAWDNNSVGVLKTTDGGSTWETTGLSFSVGQSKMVTRLLADPNDNQTIIAATSDGVYKTTNGGETWDEQLTTYSFKDMEYKPGDFNTFYGSTSDGRIYYSNDGGNNWSQSLSTGTGRVELAITAAEEAFVYAIVSADDNGLYGIYKSTDSGETFTQVLDGTVSGNNLMGWYEGDDEGGQGWYDLAIAASPIDGNILLIGGVNTWRTTDGGESWDLVTHWYGGYGAQAVHADKHMLKYRANGDLFECNDGGVYISDNDGAANSWTDKTNGMEISQIYKLSVSATAPNDVIIGLQDNGTKLTYNNTSWEDVIGGDGMECLIDYSDENIQYGSLYYGAIHRTTNQWGYDTEITPSGAGNGAWVTPYIIDPNTPETLYAGYSNVWKTTNRGNSWTQISTMSSYSKLRSMAIAPSNTDVLYVADPGTIWKTTDGGDSWTDISSGLPNNTITYIAVDHGNAEKLWVTLGGYDSNGVYESTDGGDSWTNISGTLPELPVQSIVQNKLMSTESHLYVGTSAGIYLKRGSNNWESYNDNLPNVRIGELEIYYDNENIYNSRLRAATYGRGLWQSPIYLEGENAPAVVTNSATNIDRFSATLNASVTGDFGSVITESGFLVSTQNNPDYGDNETDIFSTNPTVTEGTFATELMNLDEETTYYFRAYAINEHGTGYGAIQNFTTDGAPTYEVRFNITDQDHGQGIQNVEITINGEVLYTNVAGWIATQLPNGEYPYTIVAEDYNEMPEETVYVEDEEVVIDRIMTKVGLETMPEENLRIYPNPASETIHVEVLGVFHAELFNRAGQSVMQKRIYRNANIDISKLPKGVYFIKLSNENYEGVRKFVIE